MSDPNAREIFNNLWDEADGAETDAETLEQIREDIESNDSDDSGDDE